MTKANETRGRPPVLEDDRIEGGLFKNQKEQLKKIAKKRRVYVSQLVREAVEMYLAQYYENSGESPATKEDDANFEKLISGNQ